MFRNIYNIRNPHAHMIKEIEAVGLDFFLKENLHEILGFKDCGCIFFLWPLGCIMTSVFKVKRFKNSFKNKHMHT